MSYHNLTNEEIVFMFTVARSIKRQYEEAYAQQIIQQDVPTQFGVMKVETIIPELVREEMLKSKHYKYMSSIYDKLLPIYDIIKDVEPETVEQVEGIFDKKPE